MRIIVEPDERVYVECNGLVASVNPTYEGIIVDIFADDENSDDEDCIASAWAFYPHEDEEMCEYCDQKIVVDQGLCSACLAEQQHGI